MNWFDNSDNDTNGAKPRKLACGRFDRPDGKLFPSTYSHCWRGLSLLALCVYLVTSISYALLVITIFVCWRLAIRCDHNTREVMRNSEARTIKVGIYRRIRSALVARGERTIESFMAASSFAAPLVAISGLSRLAKQFVGEK